MQNLVFWCALTVASAIYSDQAGAVDWNHQYVGDIVQVEFSTLRRRFFVASDDGVVGSLSATTGEIVWRQVLPEGEQLNSMMLHGKSNGVLTVTEGGRHLRVFRGDKGVQAWDTELDAPAIMAAFVGNDVAVLSKNTVTLLGGVDGQAVWTKEITKAGPLSQFRPVKDSVEVLLVSGKEARVLKLDSRSGSQTSIKTVATLTSDVAEAVFLRSGAVVMLDESRGTVHSIVAGGKHEKTSLENLLPGVMSGATLLPLNIHNAVGVQSGTTTAAVTVKAGSVKAAATLKGSGVIASAQRDDKSESFIALVTTHEDKTTARRVSLKGGDVQDIEVSELNSKTNGNAVRAFLSVKDKGSDLLVIVSEDQTVSMVRGAMGGTLVWQREESLASIALVEYVRLPAGDYAHLSPIFRAVGIEGNAGIVPQFFGRISYQWRSLQEYVRALSPLDLFKSSSFRASHGASKDARQFRGGAAEQTYHAPIEDQFGFRKLIICLTSSNKLLALSSEDGRVVWSLFLADRLSDGWKAEMFVTRTAAQGNPEALIIGEDPETKKTKVIYFNPVTGEEIREEALSFVPSQIFESRHTADGNVVLLMVDAAHEVRTLPSSAVDIIANKHSAVDIIANKHSVVDIIANKQEKVYFYEVNDGILSGYVAAPAGGVIAPTSSAPLWNRRFPIETEEIVAISSARRSEKVEEAVRILGDKSVLYKHINANLIAIATVVRGYDAEGQTLVTMSGRPADSTVHVYIIDVVSGVVVYHTYKSRAAGPVQMLVTENTVLFQYWNLKSMRWELGVLDLYDSQEDTSHRDVQDFSSYTRPQPVILRQSYIIPSAINTMGVTLTKAGISSKTVLLGLENNRIHAVPREWVDARRPIDPTAADQAEGLQKYTSGLPLHDTSVINYNISLARVKGIESSPCLLESHSLVFVHGLDLFFTRLTPSKTFDKLDEDFQYAFLAGVGVILIVALVVFSRVAASKTLSSRWA